MAGPMPGVKKTLKNRAYGPDEPSVTAVGKSDKKALITRIAP